MIETLHFDYTTGRYEIRLDCPKKCRKSSSHADVNVNLKEVRIALDKAPSETAV